MVIAAAIQYIASIIGAIVVIIEAFQDEVWKGIVCILCGLYLQYYAVFELDHEWKWGIVLVLLGSSAAAATIGL